MLHRTFATEVDAAMNSFPVLMYHRIASDRCPVSGDGAGERRYAVALEAFAWQLDRLARYGRTGVSMRHIVERLAAGEQVPPGWVAITFDDGNESDFVHATPLLVDRGFTATFFVTGERVGARGGLDRVKLADMVRRGMHIGAHGMTHRFLTTLDDPEQDREISQSRELLASISGEPVDHFAPPGGRYDARTLELLRRRSFNAVCTSDFGFNPRRGERFVFRRIPVTASTSRGQFDAIASGTAWKLLPLRARTTGLVWARRSLGESAYARLRSFLTRG